MLRAPNPPRTRDPAAFLGYVARNRVHAQKILCAKSLAEFIRLGWQVLEPGTPYVEGRVIEAICQHLEAVTAGQIKRLLINVPPGTLKSLATSVFWPAWEWGPKGLPHHRFLSFSYSDRLSVRDNRRTKLLVRSEWFQDRWPLAIVSDQNAKTMFENEHRGWRGASSVGGMGTGARADRIIIDDPHPIEDANSTANLERALMWFRETLPTRVNSPIASPIVVIMQRVHERDISGEILAKEYGYEHLCLPMMYEPERHCETLNGKFEDWRTYDGQLLFPERFPQEVVDRDSIPLGSYGVAAQFQQRPAPRAGGMLRVELLDVVDDWPRDATLCRSWDFAGTAERAGGDPDYTVGAKVALKDGRAWIVDIVRGRWSPAEREAVVRATAIRDTPAVPVWIEQEPGSSGVDVIDHYSRRVLLGYTVRPSKVTGSKVERAGPFAAAVEAGNVGMLRADWNQAFVAEARTFPAGAHDDQVDAVVDAWTHLARTPFFYAG